MSGQTIKRGLYICPHTNTRNTFAYSKTFTPLARKPHGIARNNSQPSLIGGRRHTILYPVSRPLIPRTSSTCIRSTAIHYKLYRPFIDHIRSSDTLSTACRYFDTADAMPQRLSFTPMKSSGLAPRSSYGHAGKTHHNTHEPRPESTHPEETRPRREYIDCSDLR